MITYTQFDAPWLKWIAPEKFNDAKLFRIVVFFVFHSPCKNVSSMGRSLKQYGWTNPWKAPYYLNKHLLKAATNDKLLFTAENYKKMSQALNDASLNDDFSTDLATERICIHKGQDPVFISVFKHIRNAFAHCRLNLVDIEGDCIFILEDIGAKSKNSDQYKVSARMILRESTLLKWIDIIEAGEKEYKKQ